MSRLRWPCLVLVSCSSDAGSTARIVPEHLTVMALPGGSGVLELTGLSLRQGAEHPEVYAALKNVGERPACDAALSIELFDRREQSLAAGISGVLAQSFYRRTSGTDAIVSCVAPGDVGMAAITDLPAGVTADDVGILVYHCPYFALDVAPMQGLSVR
jgi:hypothetical protein